MKNFLRVLALVLLPGTALAQSPSPTTPYVARVAASCGAASLNAGSAYALSILATGELCVNASVSASITGFPGTQTTGTPISVTTGGVTGSLPAGAVVVASNVGATNGAYCKLGASVTTSDQLIPPNSWFAFTVGAATQLTCITSTSTTTVNMVGGSGLPTGSGGGGGGSGGGLSVTDGATWTTSVSSFTPSGGEYNSTPATLASGKQGTVALTSYRAFWMTPYDTTGTALFTSGNPGYVNGIGISQGSTTASQTGNLVFGAVTTSMPAYTNAQSNPLSLDPGGNLRVLPSDGTNVITVKAASTPAASTDTALVTALRPAANYHVLPAASDNHVVIKNGAGIVYGVVATNKSATANYIRLYDLGTGFNGCNSATGILWGGEIPPNDSGLAPTLAGASGVSFSTGLSICVTGAYGDTDTTNATANALIVNVSYK